MFIAPIKLTEKQEKWFARHFKNTKNSEIADKLGICIRSVSRLARKRGLTKTPQFLKKCQSEAVDAAYKSNLTNGTFPPKGFRIPRSEVNWFRAGESPIERIGPKKEKERLQKSKDSRNATLRKERARVAFGLPQKTKLKVVAQSKKKVYFRSALKKKGYVIDEDSRIVTWNEHTMRSKRMESRKQYWYKFKSPWNE